MDLMIEPEPEASAVGCFLYSEIAGRISLLESSRVSSAAAEAEDMLALANARHALAKLRIEELDGELLKLEKRASPWTSFLFRLRGRDELMASASSKEHRYEFAKAMHQACEEEKRAGAALRRAASHAAACHAQVTELKESWAAEDLVHASAFGTRCTNDPVPRGPAAAPPAGYQRQPRLALDRQGLSLVAALSTEKCRRERLLMSADRSHLSLEHLHKSNARANLARLKLSEALTTCLSGLTQDSLSSWLSGAVVTAAVCGRNDGKVAPAASPLLGKGSCSSASSSGPVEGRRPDISMPGTAPESPIKGLSSKRSGFTSRDSLNKQSWGICSISETATETDDDGGSSVHSGSYFFMEPPGSTWAQPQSGRVCGSLTTEALLSTDNYGGPCRTSGQCGMPTQLPGVVESQVWSAAITSGGLTPPLSASFNTLVLSILPPVPNTPLPPEAMELVRAAAGSAAAAYRHWQAGTQLARKAAETEEGMAPELEVAAVVLELHGASQGQPPMLSLLASAARGSQVSAMTVIECLRGCQEFLERVLAGSAELERASLAADAKLNSCSRSVAAGQMRLRHHKRKLLLAELEHGAN